MWDQTHQLIFIDIKKAMFPSPVYIHTSSFFILNTILKNSDTIFGGFITTIFIKNPPKLN